MGIPRLKVEERQPWHVMSRATRRFGLFYEGVYYTAFLGLLYEAVKASGSVLWAFALMPNHYHLMLYATSVALTECMYRVNRFYALFHNGKKGLTGHAFEAPYKAYLQPTPLLMLQKIAYIFMNPVVAGLAKRPEDYPWSGYRSFMGLEGGTMSVDATTALSKLGLDVSDGRSRFEKVMELEERLGARRKALAVPRVVLTAMDVWKAQFEWVLEYARESTTRLGSEDPTLVAMYQASEAGIPPRAIAAVLGEPDTTRIRVTLSRLRKRAREDKSLADKLMLR